LDDQEVPAPRTHELERHRDSPEPGADDEKTRLFHGDPPFPAAAPRQPVRHRYRPTVPACAARRSYRRWRSSPAHRDGGGPGPARPDITYPDGPSPTTR